MGLKWFRARLSMKKESKVPTMTGLYRKVPHFESDVSMIQKNKISAIPSSITNLTINNEKAQYNHSTADFMNQSSSLLIINSREYNNATENIESFTSTEDIKIQKNIKEQQIANKQLNKANKDQSNNPDMKPGISSDNEIVI